MAAADVAPSRRAAAAPRVTGPPRVLVAGPEGVRTDVAVQAGGGARSPPDDGRPTGPRPAASGPWEDGRRGPPGRQEGSGTMVVWWCGVGLVLAVVYMVTYTLLRTSGDGRSWAARLRRPRGARADSGPTDRQG